MVRGIGRRGLAKIVEILFSVLLVTLGLATVRGETAIQRQRRIGEAPLSERSRSSIKR